MSIIEDIDGTEVTFNDGGEIKSLNIGDIFKIDEESLIAEFSRQASLYAYFGVLAAKAEHASGVADLDADQEYAQADAAARDELDKDGRKYTEAVIKGMVVTDQQYINTMEAALLAKYDFKLVKALVAALEQRANMLISLGAFVRHEIDQTGMNIRERQMEKAVGDVKDVIRQRKQPK